MQAVKFPFRIGLDGRLSVADTYAEVVRGQLIDALMTNFNERVMRTTYGSDIQSALFDPADLLVRSDAATVVSTRVKQCTPRVILVSLGFHETLGQPGALFLDVTYRTGLLEEVQQLRLPVSNFLSEETEI